MNRYPMAAALWLLAAFAGPATADAAEDADAQAIREVALDYIEGWYSGDADRMAASLHPRLVKRIVERRDGADTLQEMTAASLIQGTGKGGGRMTPPAQQRTDVRVLDVFANTASVRVDAGEWIDYMHLARWEGEWKIVNVLWEMRPAAD
jgi:hypothetical protein